MDETIPWVETDDGPSLLGGRSKQDGKITFPMVESRIETDDLDALELGQDMVLTTIDLARGDGEGHFMTFAFKAK